jgi:hypothetical protein
MENNINELIEYLNNNNKYYKFNKTINDVDCIIYVYKSGIFTTLYYFEIYAIKKCYKIILSNSFTKIFCKSFTNLNDLITFSKTFDKDYIIISEYTIYNELISDYEYKYYKYKVQSLDYYNKHNKNSLVYQNNIKKINEILS